MSTLRKVSNNGNTLQSLVSLRSISAGYDGKEVLSGISLDIYNGDILVVTGPNGGGKTTLLKLILGLLPYSSGSVKYADCLIVDGVRRIGYLPQQNIFDRSFPISVIDVVVSGLQADRGFSRRYSEADFMRARKLLEMTRISDLERRPIGEISGGQMQRTLLCRALISEPRLLILDEPSTYVDRYFEHELRLLLRRLNSDGMSIVIVSHDATSLDGMAGRVVYVDGSIK